MYILAIQNVSSWLIIYCCESLCIMIYFLLSWFIVYPFDTLFIIVIYSLTLRFIADAYDSLYTIRIHCYSLLIIMIHCLLLWYIVNHYDSLWFIMISFVLIWFILYRFDSLCIIGCNCVSLCIAVNRNIIPKLQKKKNKNSPVWLYSFHILVMDYILCMKYPDHCFFSPERKWSVSDLYHNCQCQPD